MTEEKSALEQKILQKAAAAAAEIIKKEQDEAKRLLAAARAEADAALAAALDQAGMRGEMIRKEFEASAHLEAKLLLLKKKDEIVGRVIGQAWEQLKVRLKREDYREVVGALIQEAVGALGLSDAVVTLGANEKQTISGRLAELGNAVGAKLGWPVQLKLAAEGLNSLGGVRVTDAGQHLLYDNSWDARLERMREELNIEIAEILFTGKTNEAAMKGRES